MSGDGGERLRQVRAEHVEAIARGGAFLATGGGGDTLIGEILAERALDGVGAVDLLPLEELDDDALVVAIGSVGSPTIMQEKPGNGREAGWALDALEAFLGRRTTALIAFEAGGVNALVPFVAAAERGLPVVDADGMGRAFPELQMESFSIYGISATPLAVASELGDRVVLDHVRDPLITEHLVRQFSVVAGGGQCLSAEHCMSGAQAKEVTIPSTISLCHQIGELIGRFGNRLEPFVDALRDLLAPTHYGEVHVLTTGKVTDIERRVEGGYDFATLQVQPFAGGVPVQVGIKNEYLLATAGERVLATTPDLICALDLETGLPITAETLRYGQRLQLLAIGAPARMRTAKALEFVAPRNFGFDQVYVPIETLAANR
ncbi:MAG: DUF917 domain-containing protein [Pseudomonadota bacterium]